MSTTPAPGYVATDLDGTAIYGIGPTASAAVADALNEGASRPRDGWITYPATAELLEQVRRVGGAGRWQLLNGVACTDEADREG